MKKKIFVWNTIEKSNNYFFKLKFILLEKLSTVYIQTLCFGGGGKGRHIKNCRAPNC